MKSTPDSRKNALLEYLIRKYGIKTIKSEANLIKNEINKNNKISNDK